MGIGFPPVILTLAGFILAGIATGQWWMLITNATYTFGMLGAVDLNNYGGNKRTDWEN